MDTAIRKRTAFTIGAFSVEGQPSEGVDPIIRLSSDELTALVGYGEHDSYACNPLENSDSLGTIHHHPRSRYGGRDSDYYEVLGLDSYGNPDLDLIDDATLRDKYIAYFIEQTSVEDCDAEWNREGEVEEEDDEVFVAACAAADWDGYPRLYSDQLDTLRLEAWKLALEAGGIGDPDAVLLDRYEHGLCRYSVSSGRRDWDLSSGEAVWVPGDYVREELLRRAAVYAFGRIEEVGYRSTRKYVATFDPAFRKDSEDFEDWGKAFTWLQLVSIAEGWQATPEQLRAARHRAAAELAEQACDVYTEWCNGNCYGIVVELHRRTDEEAEWVRVAQLDSCSGYYGSDDAEGQLADMVAGLEDRLHG